MTTTTTTPPNVLGSGPLTRVVSSGLSTLSVIRTDYANSRISRVSILRLELILLGNVPATLVPQPGTVTFTCYRAGSSRVVRQEVAYAPRGGGGSLQRVVLTGFTDITRLECQLSSTSLPLERATASAAFDNIEVIIASVL
jgi:hypothetical protein